MDRIDKNKGYSLSYNTSILNGLYDDTTACTYMYMVIPENIKKYADKYILNKYFYNDINMIENQLFFIPPLYPYLQLCSYGELWHVRTKIPSVALQKYTQNFSGIYNESIDHFPDYLTNNLALKDMENEFTLYLKKYRKKIENPHQKEYIGELLYGGKDKYFYKYSKYKMKYLNLKQI